MKPEQAIHSPAFPSNPTPFLDRIRELVQTQGTKAIREDEAKACLLILIHQAYGQLVTLDTMEEFARLEEILEDPWQHDDQMERLIRKGLVRQIPEEGEGIRIPVEITDIGRSVLLEEES